MIVFAVVLLLGAVDDDDAFGGGAGGQTPAVRPAAPGGEGPVPDGPPTTDASADEEAGDPGARDEAGGGDGPGEDARPGSSAPVRVDPVRVDPVRGDPVRGDPVRGHPSTAALPSWVPPEGTDPPTPAGPRTKLELEIAQAGIEPARYPLVQLRLEESRLAGALAQAEARGHPSARDVERRWLAARALLVDVERVALHRMQRCAKRTGQETSVRQYRMTAGGPVVLSPSELVAQANALDPVGCARIDLVDASLIDRVRRARELKETLPTMQFAFHELERRRALEDELRSLLKALGAEGLERIVVAGERGYGR